MLESPSDIEAEIVAKGLTAPRITSEDIKENISEEFYFTAGDGIHGRIARDFCGRDRPESYPASVDTLTFCVLILRNGFAVTGESACVSPENFDAEEGRKIARANAVDKIWPLMGCELRSKLANA